MNRALFDPLISGTRSDPRSMPKKERVPFIVPKQRNARSFEETEYTYNHNSLLQFSANNMQFICSINLQKENEKM